MDIFFNTTWSAILFCFGTLLLWVSGVILVRNHHSLLYFGLTILGSIGGTLIIDYVLKLSSSSIVNNFLFLPFAIGICLLWGGYIYAFTK